MLQPPGISFIRVADEAVTVPLMFLRRTDDEREALRAMEDIAREVSAALLVPGAPAPPAPSPDEGSRDAPRHQAKAGMTSLP